MQLQTLGSNIKEKIVNIFDVIDYLLLNAQKVVYKVKYVCMCPVHVNSLPVHVFCTRVLYMC